MSARLQGRVAGVFSARRKSGTLGFVTEPGEVEIYLGGSSQATAKALLQLTKP